ncbi:hypothetical protein Hanom_Chr12g01084821 [Helianthus anomalus]
MPRSNLKKKTNEFKTPWRRQFKKLQKSWKLSEAVIYKHVYKLIWGLIMETVGSSCL